jgi:hypothetical protein
MKKFIITTFSSFGNEEFLNHFIVTVPASRELLWLFFIMKTFNT